MTTLHLTQSIGRSSWRRGFLFIQLVLACLALPPTVRAVCQQGCDGSNTFLGDDALLNNTTGFSNTAIGGGALYSNTTGIDNTANGISALGDNTTGSFNTANGYGALTNNTIGDNNTAIGTLALRLNTTGSSNMASGICALESNTTGYGNTANGSWALYVNTTGSNNTANGTYALYNNADGNSNTANGGFALASNTNGFQNTATGWQALQNNRSGIRNTASGYQALWENNIGTNNTAEGFQALYHNTGSNNVGLGFNAGNNLTHGSGNVCIGYRVLGVAGESNTTRIRNVYTSVASGRAVYINSDNKIGTLVSSRRFKDEINPMEEASEAILKLKPVTFHYKKEIEPNGAIMFGLIAEEVEKVDPDLVTRNEKGEAEGVRYEAVNAMLLNEFLKEHRTVQEQKATIAELKNGIERLAAHLKEQDSKIEKVSAQLEAKNPAQQIVFNNQ
jgi:hypothetical protein